MMIEDYVVQARSTKKLEEISLAWRDAFGVPNEWAPDVVDVAEKRLPEIFTDFALVVRPDSEMGEAEAFTEFDPPQIVVRESVYRKAIAGDGRSRMTLAHEIGHLVMHAGVPASARMIDGNKQAPTHKLYQSAEWQARKFASLFLMPSHIVREFASAAQIAECCLVSHRAAEIRFSEMERCF
jgi:hypothetical protein